MLSHYFYEKLLRCSFISPFRNKAFKHLTFMINRAPKVQAFTVDFDKKLIKMPLPA
jgi:hypothetical protein